MKKNTILTMALILSIGASSALAEARNGYSDFQLSQDEFEKMHKMDAGTSGGTILYQCDEKDVEKQKKKREEEQQARVAAAKAEQQKEYARNHGLYLGFGLGATKYLDNGYLSAIGISNTSTTSLSDYRVYFGYKFNKVFSVEADYSDYGTFGAEDNSFAQNPKSVGASALLGYSFFNQTLQPFIQLGAEYITMDYSGGSDLFETTEEKVIALRYGLGLVVEPEPLGGLGFRAILTGSSFNAKYTTITPTQTISVTARQTILAAQVGIQYRF